MSTTVTIVVTDERRLVCPACSAVFVGNKSDPGAWEDFLDELQEHQCDDFLDEMRYAVSDVLVTLVAEDGEELLHVGLGDDLKYTLLGAGKIDPEEYLSDLDDPDYDG